MIKFNEKDNNKQFISIIVEDNTSTETIKEKIKGTYAVLQKVNMISDKSEIVIEIDNDIKYGFSLNELREYIKPIAAVTVSHFAVDMDEPTQRYYG